MGRQLTTKPSPRILISRASAGGGTVDAFVADITDPSLRAQFSSYVRIDA